MGQLVSKNLLATKIVPLLYKGDVALLDELFHSTRPVLTGVDADSTYCFLLEAVEHRDEDTWGYYLLELEQQGLNPDYTIAGSASRKCGIGDHVMPTPRGDRQLCPHGSSIFLPTMNPNPFEIADH